MESIAYTNNSCSSSSSSNNSNNDNNHNIYVLNSNQMLDAALSDFNNCYRYELLPYTVKQTATDWWRQQRQPHLSFKPTTPTSKIAQSSSSHLCSPAYYALEKLFRCSFKLLNCTKCNQKPQYYDDNINKSLTQSTATTTNQTSSKSTVWSSEKWKTYFNCYQTKLLAKKFKFWQYFHNERSSRNHEMFIKDGINYWSICCATSNGIKQTKSNINAADHKIESKDLWAMSCDLCDNCRCINCQSTYFDYNDCDNSSMESDYEFDSNDEDSNIAELDYNLVTTATNTKHQKLYKVQSG